MNLESLVTKDFLESRLDVRFAEQNAAINTRFAEQRAYIDTKFEQVKTRFAEQKADTDTNFRVLFWIQGILVAGIVLPTLERLLAL